MKRFSRPLLFAALCWILVALVPATRHDLRRARLAAFPPDETYGETNARLQSEVKSRFPDDPRVRLDALTRLGSGATPAQIAEAARGLPENATLVAVLLTAQVGQLKHNRYEGPLSNPGGTGAPLKPPAVPDSPRADYDRFIALARRGQRLEPNNTFFDWMILYALYATRRDDEARAVLKLAARKTGYDEHSREVILNRLAVQRRLNGAPLTPLEDLNAWAITFFPHYGKMRQTARWISEGVIADRAAARHTRALDTAFDLTKLSRVLRRESYSLIGSLVGTAMESIAILKTVAPPPLAARVPMTRAPRLGAPVAALQSSAVSLHAYAKSQNRADITAYLDREWPEMGKWRSLSKAIIDQSWMGNSDPQTIALTAAARLRALTLRALPSLLCLGALFALLSRRFRDDSGAGSGFWRGIIAGTALLALALAFDALILFGQTDSYSLSDFSLSYLEGAGLIAKTPSWATMGLALITILLGLNAAILWQTRQMRPRLPFRARLQTFFAPPEDGLMRFDFGWWIGLVAKSTGWILLIGAFLTTVFNFAHGGYAEDDPALYGTVLMAASAGICLGLSYAAWSRKPRRRQTLRLAWRLIAQAFCGFLVAASALYALISFAFLPLAARYDANFESAMQRGEMQIARAKLGF